MFMMHGRGKGLQRVRIAWLLCMMSLLWGLQSAWGQSGEANNVAATVEAPRAPADTTATLEVRSYKIAARDGARLKALLTGLMHLDTHTSPTRSRRLVILNNDDLFVRDTPDNIRKLEDLGSDPAFTDLLHGATRETAHFNLTPPGCSEITDQLLFTISRIVEMIKTMLYSQKGEAGANAEGRSMFYDPYALELIVVDDPVNLARVRRFLDALAGKQPAPVHPAGPNGNP